MSRRVAVTALLLVVALFVIDWGSRFLPPCGFILYGSGQDYENAANQEYCAERKGLIVAGLEVLSEIKPEIWTALATVAIAVFTLTLKLSTDKLWGASQTQLRIANQEFIASHKPLLRIRNIVINRPTAPDGPAFVEGHRVTGQFSIENVGGSRADILDGHCMVFWSDGGLPMRRPYEGEEGNLRPADRTLLSGQSTTAPFISSAIMEQRVASTVGRPIAGGYDLWVMGWIAYADRNNDVWRIAFCGEYKYLRGFGGARFYPIDDFDYEHGGD